MNIRPATAEDKEQLIRLFIAFDHAAEKILSEQQLQIRAVADLENLAKDIVTTYLTDPNYRVFVAEENGMLRGYISGKTSEKKYRIYDKEGYIEHWFVEEEYREKGVGKKLFDEMIEAFKKASCSHVTLDTNHENTKAITIYGHMGFSKRLVTFFKPLES